jgi:hypothetical protein
VREHETKRSIYIYIYIYIYYVQIRYASYLRLAEAFAVEVSAAADSALVTASDAAWRAVERTGTPSAAEGTEPIVGVDENMQSPLPYPPSTSHTPNIQMRLRLIDCMRRGEEGERV